MKTNPRVHAYFEKGYYRSRDPLPPRRGEVIRGHEQLVAQFFLDVRGDRIQGVSYKCSTCVVLVAYCELLTEMIAGLSLREASHLTPPALIQAFPEVPHYRHDRASLAIRALHSAVHHAQSELPDPQQTRNI